MNRRFLAIALAMLVAMAALPLGPVGTAAAVNPLNGECEQGERAVDWLPLLTIVTDDCWSDSHNTSIEDKQSETDIYQSAQNQNANTEVYHTGLDNYLQDTENVAFVHAKNAYIRSLNNGSSGVASKTAAKEANGDYYAVKQHNLLEAWNATLAHAEYLENLTDNETGINDTFHEPTWVPDKPPSTTYVDNVTIDGFGTKKVILVNGTETTVKTMRITVQSDGSGSGPYTVTEAIGPTMGETVIDADGGNTDAYEANITGLQVRAPSGTDYTPVQYLSLNNYGPGFTSVDSQQTGVESEIDTLVNKTYSEYQAGEINNTDLVDPYVLQHQYSPNESFDSWAVSTLTTLGTDGPENLSTTGSFVVQDHAQQTEVKGILMSQGNPSSGAFEAGTKYDATNLSGQQYVVTGTNMHELTGNFTVENITDNNGNQLNSSTMRDVNYKSANVTEMIQMYEDLRQRRAELEALQTAGGGAFFGGSSGTMAVVLALGGAYYLARGRRDRPRY